MAGAIPIAFLSNKAIVTIGGGLLEDAIVNQLQADLADAILEHEIDGLIIDISGVAVLDSYLTRVVRDVALVARLAGARTVVCGMRPAIAITLVEMGLDLPGVHTALNLDRAVAWMGSAGGMERAERSGRNAPRS